jgi:hypothetical protein
MACLNNPMQLNNPIPEDLVPILAKDEEKQKQIKEKSAEDASSSGARAIATVPPPGTAGVSPSPSHQAPPTTAKPAVKGGAVAAKNGVVVPAKKPSDGIPASASATAKPDPSAKNGRVSMFIQAIPPFKAKAKPGVPVPAAAPSAAPSGSGPPSASATPPAAPSSPATTARLNANAPLFRPMPKACISQLGTMTAGIHR